MKKGILADSFFAHIIKFFVCHVKVFVHLPPNVHENFGGGQNFSGGQNFGGGRKL